MAWTSTAASDIILHVGHHFGFQQPKVIFFYKKLKLIMTKHVHNSLQAKISSHYVIIGSRAPHTCMQGLTESDHIHSDERHHNIFAYMYYSSST